MRYYLRIYRLLFAQFLKTRMEYRADFVISTIGMAMRQAAALFGLWVLFYTINDLQGWSIYELIFIYGFIQLVVVPQQTCMENLWQFSTHLRSGTFIKYYMKPMNSLFFFLSDMFDIKGLSQLLIGIVALVWASQNMTLSVSVFSLLGLIAAYFMAVFILGTVMLISGTIGFWTMAQSALLFTERLKGYAHYPMTIFSQSLRFVFSYILPLGFLAFYPCQAFLRGDSMSTLLLTMLTLCIVLGSFAYWFWLQGMRRYEGTGS